MSQLIAALVHSVHRTDRPTPVRRTGTPAMSPAVLRLRMQMRAAHYNPDLSHSVEALACVAAIDTARLAAVLTGNAPLDWRIPQRHLAEILGVEAVTA